MAQRKVAKTSGMRKATRRNEKWRALSLVEQRSELDRRLGRDKGAVKQRSKLARKMHILDTAARAHSCDENCGHIGDGQ